LDFVFVSGILLVFFKSKEVATKKDVMSLCNSCCPFWHRLRNHGHDETNNAATASNKFSVICWLDLMTFKGAELWRVRKQVIEISSSLSSSRNLPISLNRRKELITFFWKDNDSFLELEEQQGLDKSNTGIPPRRLPLTKITGTEWERQRPLICAVFSNLPKLSLEAVKVIDWRRTLEAHDIRNNDAKITTDTVMSLKVDLKQVILELSLAWLLRLFCGNIDPGPNPDWQERLKTSCFDYWKQSRALNKDKKAVHVALIAFEEALPWNYCDVELIQLEYKGLLKALHTTPGISRKQATDNAVNAMIASLDAVQSLVFWTLWNLSKTEKGWDHCRVTDQQAQRDLVQLALFKRQATQGKPIQLQELSYLGRALIETVRVYPPIWTLPRTWHTDDCISSKWDVLSCNRATSRDWNPVATDYFNGSYVIASFGWGKRHCPAGTAGLYAAYEMIRALILEPQSSMQECESQKALRNCHLAPTLSVHGPQYFLVSLQKESVIK
jgi:cytochrome P450